MSYIKSAHARLLAALENPPAEIQLYPTPEDFEERKDYLDNLARAFGDFFHALAIDTNSNTSVNILTKEAVSLIQDAVFESDLYCSLEDAAERQREEMMEGVEA